MKELAEEFQQELLSIRRGEEMASYRKIKRRTTIHEDIIYYFDSGSYYCTSPPSIITNRYIVQERINEEWIDCFECLNLEEASDKISWMELFDN